MKNRKNKVKGEQFEGFEIVTNIQDRQRKSNNQIISIFEEKLKQGNRILNIIKNTEIIKKALKYNLHSKPENIKSE